MERTHPRTTFPFETQKFTNMQSNIHSQQPSMSTGLPDSAIRDAHDMIHHAEQEEHEHEAAEKRGLPDKAVEAEHEFMQHAEDELDEFEVRDFTCPIDALMMSKY